MGAEAELDSVERRQEGDVNVEKEGEEEKSFEELGLDEQLTRALRKKSITDPTPIQRTAIPLILSGKNVVARAKTGSGKTFAYLLPMLHELLRLSSENSLRKSAPNVFILVPTRDLCHQVYSEASSLLEFCSNKFKIVHLMATMPMQDMRVALSGPPNIVVATPACISTCTSKGVLRAVSIRESISMLILDEADLLLSHGHEADLKALIPHIPRSCQCILMSATTRFSNSILSSKFSVIFNYCLYHVFVLIATYPKDGFQIIVFPKDLSGIARDCARNLPTW